MNSISVLKHQLTLINLERSEEILRYQSLLLKTSINDRKKKGLTWYPVTVENEKLGVGNQLIVKLQKTHSDKIPHNFQSGQTATLFGSNPVQSERLSLDGVVKRVAGSTIWLVFKGSDLPDWTEKGKLGIDLVYNETTYKEMEKAIKRLLEAKKNSRLYELREMLLGNRLCELENINYKPETLLLNESQLKAVNKLHRAKDVAIIHGPPGTGKTTTLVHAIKQTVKNKHQVLVCAPSNTAVDLLSEKLLAQGVSVARIGHPARVNEDLQNITIDALVSLHHDHKQVKQMRKEAAHIKQQALKYKRNFGYEERQARREAMNQYRILLDYARSVEQYIVDSVINNAEVITATLVGAANNLLGTRQFHTVFIDEAAQALEPATWIPITKAKRVVFAGDHCQLPPTVKSMQAQKDGLSISLFEKCMQRIPQMSSMLDTQYRMNKKIMQFSSEQFYNNELKAHSSVQYHILGIKPDSPDLLTRPFALIDTAGCGFDEQQKSNSKSLCNPKEAELLLSYLTLLFRALEQEQLHQVADYSIGIISPYKSQVGLLKEMASSFELIQRYRPNISIHTVDGFQGQERDIVAMSLVRSNEKSEIGFLKDIRRTNVAMTRAKKKLVMFGDSATFGNHPFYKDLLTYAENNNAYRSAWELLYQ